jgi:hypothetical protein
MAAVAKLYTAETVTVRQVALISNNDIDSMLQDKEIYSSSERGVGDRARVSYRRIEGQFSDI